MAGQAPNDTFRRPSADPDIVAKDVAGNGSVPQAATRPHVRPSSGINNPLTWLVNAFKLQSQNIPRSLNVKDVLPIVDASGFAGWGMATYASYVPTWNAAGGVASYLMVPIDPVNTQVLVACQLLQNRPNEEYCFLGIASANQFPSLALRNTPDGTPIGSTYAAIQSAHIMAQFWMPGFTTNQESVVTLNSILGPGRMIVMPPGFGMFFTTIGGTTMITNPGCTYLVATIPGQFGAGR